jgi:hypothetical protein
MESGQAVSSPRTKLWPLVFGAVVFVSALLLFQVQLIIAKYILPWFGGSSAVWTTCVLFFQVLLLLGYGYTHLTRDLLADVRRKLHIGLLLFSVAVLIAGGIAGRSPITVSVGRLLIPEQPTASVLLVLLLSVGLPFFVLSTTSPLLQQWFWQSEHRRPYHLYALSNLGSLIGLLSYPFLVEPRISVIHQGWAWSATYMAFIAGTAVLAMRTANFALPQAPARSKRSRRSPTPETAAKATVCLWVFLAAAGSSAMLATTNYLTQDIASVPLLWVLPLSIYLVSFVITFDNDRAYRRAIIFPGAAFSVAGVCYVLAKAGTESIWIEIVVLDVALLFVTVLCHGELARLKPDPTGLTRFYLWVAAGGAIGSAFAGLVAPHVFSGLWEFPITLVGVAIFALVAVVRDDDSWPRHAGPWKVALVAACAGILPLLVSARAIGSISEADNHLNSALLIAMAALAAFLYWRQRKTRVPAGRNFVLASLFVIPILLAVLLSELTPHISGKPVFKTRNFYGVLSVTRLASGSEIGPLKLLYHGRILHGIQAEKPEFRDRPTTYYGVLSGAGLALLHHPRLSNPDPQQRDLRVGVVGMGVATLLAYGRPGDYFRVYELNPVVADLSRGSDPMFANVRDCQAKCDVEVGDGRLLLQHEVDSGIPQRFDVLALDAFSGDAIPVHLLTREAFELYLKHLRNDDSIIAVHVSTSALNLAPVVARISREVGLHAVEIQSPARGLIIRPSVWILASRRERPIDFPRWALQGDTVTQLPGTGPLWTDDFSDLLSAIRWR